MQKPIGEHMSAFHIPAKLNLINGKEITAHPFGHRFNRADPIGGTRRDNPLFPSDQSDDRWTTYCNNPVVNLSGKQAQWQPDNTRAMRQHPFNRIVGFSGIRRPQNGRDTGFVHLNLVSKTPP